MLVAEQHGQCQAVFSLPASNILVKWNLPPVNLQSQILLNSNNVNYDVSCAIDVLLLWVILLHSAKLCAGSNQFLAG